MKTKKIKPLSEVEWTTCWMAIRYAMGRQTIASATLPSEIIEAYYHRFSDNQKKSIVRDLKEYLKDREYFGDKNIDDRHWKKFLGLLDEEAHFNVELIDGSLCKVFTIDGMCYPVEKLKESFYHDWFVPKESIKGE